MRKINKKKKGFSLIELLGVIVILAIIAVIATPIVFSMVNQTRRNAFKASAQALADAAGNYIFEEEAAGREINWKTNKITNEQYISFNLANEAEASKLNVKGKRPTKGRVEITKQGKTFVVAIERDLCAKKDYGEAEVNILSLRSDDICLLTDNTSELNSDDAEDIISTVTNLVDRVETLESENSSLKTKVHNLETNGIGSVAALDKIYPVGSIYISTSISSASAVSTALGGGTWVAYGNGRVLRGTTSNPEDTNNVDGTVTLTTSNLPSHTHTVGAHSHGLNSHTHTYDKSSTATAAATGNTGSTTLTVNQIPSHTHVQNIGTHNAVVGGGSYRNSSSVSGEYVPSTTVTTAFQQITGSTGGGGGHTHSLNSHTHGITLTSTNTGAASGSTANSTAFNSGSTGSGTAFSVLDPYITVYMYKRTA